MAGLDPAILCGHRRDRRVKPDEDKGQEEDRRVGAGDDDGWNWQAMTMGA
ncbi:MAG: hypothetical protein U1E46_02605 [Hyphomicrobiales bacterium]